MGYLDPLFRYVESSAPSLWLVESPSLFAFPGVLAVHTIGLGLVAGLSGALDLVLLGAAPGVRPLAFERVRALMWLGLWANVLSGLALVMAYPTKALTNPVFYLKLSLIGAALWMLRAQFGRIRRGDLRSAATKGLAVASLAAWAGAITAGRLLAYTCSRLTVDTACQ